MKSLIILFICLPFWLPSSTLGQDPFVKVKKKKSVKKISTICKVSVYTASPEETDSTYLVTANGSYIDTNKLNSGRLKWIAVSPNLLKRNGGIYNFNDTIKVISSNKKFSGSFIVKDVMNPRFKNKIDFLFPLTDFRLTSDSTGRKLKLFKSRIPLTIEIV